MKVLEQQFYSVTAFIDVNENRVYDVGEPFGTHPQEVFVQDAVSGVDITIVDHPPDAELWTAVEIGWPSISGLLYQGQWASELDSNTWFDLDQPVPGNGSSDYVFDTARDRGKRYYRVTLAE